MASQGVDVTSQGGRVGRMLTGSDPAGILYGAIVSATALAAVSLSSPEAARVAITTGGVLVIYWLADLYVHALAMRFDGDARGLPSRLASSASRKSGVLKGGLPGIIVYVGVYLLTDDASAAAYAALGSAIVILTVAGYLGARHAGDSGAAALVEGAGAGLLGLLVLLAKSLLH